MAFKSGDIIVYTSDPDEYFLILAHDEDNGDYWFKSLSSGYRPFHISSSNYIRQEALYVDQAATLASEAFRGAFEEIEDQVINYIANKNFIYW